MSEKVHEILKGIDLSDQKDTRSSALSGGQKRKLCVGMALIGDPKILFLEAPTAGMDPYSRFFFFDFIFNSIYKLEIFFFKKKPIQNKTKIGENYGIYFKEQKKIVLLYYQHTLWMKLIFLQIEKQSFQKEKLNVLEVLYF